MITVVIAREGRSARRRRASPARAGRSAARSAPRRPRPSPRWPRPPGSRRPTRSCSPPTSAMISASSRRSQVCSSSTPNKRSPGSPSPAPDGSWPCSRAGGATGPGTRASRRAGVAPPDFAVLGWIGQAASRRARCLRDARLSDDEKIAPIARHGRSEDIRRPRRPRASGPPRRAGVWRAPWRRRRPPIETPVEPVGGLHRSLLGG